MCPTFTVHPAWLKAISALLFNIAAGLILLLPTIKDALVLILDIFFVIVCVVIAVKAEEILEKQ